MSKQVFKLTYIIEDNQQKRFFELAERYRTINGWNEKELLQFAVLAKNQEALEMKMNL